MLFRSTCPSCSVLGSACVPCGWRWPCSVASLLVPYRGASMRGGGGPHNTAAKSSPGCLCLLFSFLLREPPRIFWDFLFLRLHDRSSKCNVGYPCVTELQEQDHYLTCWDFTETFNSLCCSFHPAHLGLHRLLKINYWHIILERRLTLGACRQVLTILLKIATTKQ